MSRNQNEQFYIYLSAFFTHHLNINNMKLRSQMYRIEFIKSDRPIPVIRKKT